MYRLPCLFVFLLPLASVGQPPAGPRIELSASGTEDMKGEGPVTVSGKIVLPPGWRLTVHTLTVRYQANGGSTTFNALLPVKGSDFNLTLSLKAGSYKVWAVIDAKDAEGRERQVSSDPQTATVR